MTRAGAIRGESGSGTQRAAWIVITLAAVFATLPVFFATRDGIGVSADSTQYLFVARSLLRGDGLMTLWWAGHPVPLTHFPPAYPATLALLGRWSADPAAGARVLGLALVATNVVLVAALARQAAPDVSRIRAWVAAGAAALCAVATDLAIAGSMAWSETPFITLLLLTLLNLDSSLRPGAPTVPPGLIAAAVTAGVATLFRYTGIALIGAGALALFSLSPASWRVRSVRAFVFGTIAVVPFVLWSLYNIGRSGNASNREVTLHLISASELRLGAETLTDWFAPAYAANALRIAALLVIAIVGAWSLAILIPVIRAAWHDGDRASPPSGTTRSLAKLLVFVATYGLFLVLSISLADKSTGLDPRILAPALPVVLAALTAGTGVLFASSRAPLALRRAIMAAGAIYLAAHVAGLSTWIGVARRDGLGLARIQRASPEFMASVAAVPATARVYSNMPYLLHYLTGRASTGFPWRHSPTSLRSNPAFREQLRAMGASAEGEPVYLVQFEAGLEVNYVATLADAAETLRLTTLQSHDGGTIAQVTGRK